MPRTTSLHRRGWTWVEVVVILAVIALLVVLIVPAIQQAREAARRTQCRSNLKSFGLALHTYHDDSKTFPPGYYLASDGPYLGWGWMVLTIPYIDATPLYNQLSFDFPRGYSAALENQHFVSEIPMFVCPSAGSADRLKHVFVSTSPVTEGIVTPATLDVPNHFARSNYFGVVGYLHADVGGIAYDASGEPAGQPPLVNAGSLGNIGTTFSIGHRYCDPANFRGVFGQYSWTKITDITDLTSNTLIVGERYTPRNEQPGAVGHGTWVGVPDCSTAAGLAMALGDTAVRINAGAKTRAETTGFGSLHTGGSHFLFADGAVKFLSETTDMALYRDLSTIADGRNRSPD